MKKTLLAIAIVFLLLACDNFSQNTTVINNSSRTILFQWTKENSSIIALNPNEMRKVNYGVFSVYNLQPEKRVTQSLNSGSIISVTDISPYEVRVENSLSRAVTLTAGGWMENMVDIAPGWNDDDNHKGLVYTTTPNFHVPSDTFPVKVEYQFINNIFYVKIY
ncbi:MAG: hypothetical protein LBI14_09450 [Treponema sp.]|jgi:hypothetical protein|nr:hypothetical protein [Treponema sp.]